MILSKKGAAPPPNERAGIECPVSLPQKDYFFSKGPRNFGKRFVCVIFWVICFSFSFRLPLCAQYKAFYTYYNFLYGAKSLGMGNAFTAAADDLTTVFRNPAGLVNFPYPSFHINYRADKMGYDLETQEKDFAGEAQRFDYEFASKLRNIGFLSISAPVTFWDVKWNFALSYYRFIPYGFVGYSRSTFLRGSERSQSTVNISGSSGVDVLAFSMAFHLLKGAAFGMTFQHFLNSGSLAYDPDWNITGSEGTEKIEGRNLILGLLLEIYQDVNIGFSFHTPLKGTFSSQRLYHQEDGAAKEISEEDELYMPAKFSLGVHIRLVKFLNLAYEFSRIYWSKGKVGDYAFPVGDDYGFPQADIINHRFGVESPIAVKETLVVYLRAGLSWDKQLFRGADDAGVWLKGYSFGCGVFALPRVKLELGFMHQRGKWLEAAYYEPGDFVNVKYRNNVFSLGLTYYFVPPTAKRPGSIYR